MDERNTFTRISLDLFLADLDRWLIERVDAIPADRGGKPQDAFFDRGSLAAFREVRRMVCNTRNEPSI